MIFPPFNQSGIRASFRASLQNSLIPSVSMGSSTPTFTRASTAYQIDFEGKYNLLPAGAARMQGARYVRNYTVKSEDLTAATGGWTLLNMSIASGVSDPNGGTTAYTITDTSGINSQWQRNTSAAVSADVVNSVWIRRRTGTGTIGLFYAGGSVDDITAVVTSSWKRVSNLKTGIAGFIGVQLNVLNDAVDIWHPQQEIVTGQTNQNPSEYVSVGVLSAPYHGAGVDGVKYFDTLNGNTVASNVVTEATGAHIDSSQAACAGGVAAGVVDASGPIGEITTPSLANVLGTTDAVVRTMADAGWVASNVTKGTTTGTDGTANSAAKLTATAGNGTVLYTTVLGAAVRTYVAWVKRVTGTGTVNITGDNGVTWTPITLTTTYKPFLFTTASAANPIVGFQLVTDTDAIAVDWNTLVAGSVAPPTPIPLNVTTAAEVTQGVSAGNISATATSITMHITPTVALTAGTEYFHWASYVDANNYTALLSDGTNLIARKRIGGTNHDATIAWNRAAGTTIKAFARFDTTHGIDVGYNGTLGTPDTTTTASQIGTNFQIGADGNGANQDYCEHRFFVAYPKGLATSKLEALTL